MSDRASAIAAASGSPRGSVWPNRAGAGQIDPVQGFHSIPKTLWIAVVIALGHHRRLMPKKPLHLVQLHSCLNQSSRECVLQIVEMKILDLSVLQCSPKRAPDVSSPEGEGRAKIHGSKD
jgi:hypothetical protein